MGDDTKPPVACSLSRQDLKLRAKRWLALVRHAGQHVSPTSSGLRLTFRQAPGVAAELDELAALERECCAFARWSVTAAGDQLVLDISAEDQVAVEAVQAMFDAPPPFKREIGSQLSAVTGRA